MNATIIATKQGFYVTGGTLRRDAPSYIERQADRTLLEDLLQGKFCYVLTSRQMGKSSLMVRTAARMREEGVGVAVLDLTAIGQNLTADQWYDGLLGRIGQQLQLEDEIEEFWLNHPRLGPLQCWMSAITEVVLPRYPGRLVIFVDEIDAVRSLPFSTDEFFAGIREFYNRRTEEPELERLTFCLLGVATPSDLIRDTRTTPFNIGQRVELNDFTEAEAAPLAQGLQKSPDIGARLLERVLYWTGGHPYLTQRLCQAIAEEVRADTPDEIDRLCQELFLSHQAQERDDNLLFVRERMLRSEVDLASLLSLYGQVRRGKRVRDDVTNLMISILRLSGVTHVASGYLRVRNRIYARVFGREWVKENMPDAELRRQREAYRQGLLRAAAIAALIIAAIGALAAIAVQQRNRAKAEASRAEQQEYTNRRLLYAAHMNLAGQAWENANLERVEELLEVHRPHSGEEDLRGFEWYYLWHQSHGFLSILPHNSTVFSVAFSPDGRRLATGSKASAVKLWDAATGQELLTLKGDSNYVWSVAFSPDGKRLATGSEDHTAKLWDAATGQELLTLKGHSGPVMSVAFSPDGKKLATGSKDPIVKLWDTVTGQELLTLKGQSGTAFSVAFSPDGRRLATGREDLRVNLWDAATGQELLTLKGHSNYVWSVAFSPDGKRLATGSLDHTAKLWDAATGQELLTLKGHLRDVRSVAFSPDGKRLATGSEDNTVKLWEAATGQELLTLKGHSAFVRSVTFSPDGKRLATGSSDGTVKLWDAATDQELLTLKGHSSSVRSVAFSPDGKKLATESKDHAVNLWDAATGQELLTLKGHLRTVRSVAFSPDGRRLATGSEDNTAKLWDAATGQELLTLKGHSGPVVSVAFSPDGKRLATGNKDYIVKLWDAVTGQELLTLKGHSSTILSVAFSPDGKRLATVSSDYTVKMWEGATNSQTPSRNRCRCLIHVPRRTAWTDASLIPRLAAPLFVPIVNSTNFCNLDHIS